VEHAAAALSHLTYTPMHNYHGPDTIMLSVNDTGNHGAGGWSTDMREIPMQILAANDAPIVRLPPQPQSAIEDTELVLQGIFLVDVDLDHSLSTGAGFTASPPRPLLTSDHVHNIVVLDEWSKNVQEWKETMRQKGHVFGFNNTHETDHHFGDDTTAVDRRLVTLTMSCEHGSLTLTNLDEVDVNLTRGDGELDAYVVLVGPLYEMNRAIQDMSYQPDRDFHTHGKRPDVLTLILDDMNNVGVEGTGEHHHVTAKLRIEVAPTNDPPIVHAPGIVSI